MIHSIKVRSGFAAELPCLKDRTFEFKPGLNLLFGPNACGKTSLMKIIGAYSCVLHEGGWSQRPRGMYLKKREYPKDLEENSPGKCKADVDWDGSATFFNQSSVSDSGQIGYFESSDARDSIDGITNMDDQITQIMCKPSTGQLRLLKLKRITETLQKPPKLWSMGKSSRKKEKKKEKDVFVDYILSLPRKGPTTVLLDEPDKGLDIRSQAKFWMNFVTGMAEKFQIIASSHSLVALMRYWPKHKKPIPCNFIHMDEKETTDAILWASIAFASDGNAFIHWLRGDLDEAGKKSEKKKEVKPDGDTNNDT
jgi:energy-coupling factor transporter ATP-binding protein EcfA2